MSFSFTNQKNGLAALLPFLSNCWRFSFNAPKRKLSESRLGSGLAVLLQLLDLMCCSRNGVKATEICNIYRVRCLDNEANTGNCFRDIYWIFSFTSKYYAKTCMRFDTRHKIWQWLQKHNLNFIITPFVRFSITR